MAKITPGPLAGVVSGKIGNTVFSRGKYGPYIRNRMMPTRTQSAATQDVRGRLSSLSKAWGALMPNTQTSWKTWAITHPVTDRLGASNVLQGSAAYIQLNARILQALGTQIDLPPVASSPAPISGLTVVAYVNTQAVTLSWTSGALPANKCLAVRIAAIDTAGRSYYANLLKLVKISAAAQATGLNVGPDFLVRFGIPILNQVLKVECEVWDKVTGLISGSVFAECTVLAAAP
jgi:hypothetical protein